MLGKSKENEVVNLEQQDIDYIQLIEQEELLIAEEESNAYSWMSLNRKA